jgi:hypothetical protein
MSEAAAPPPGGDENRGPRLIAVYWVMNAVSVAVICLRLYGRRLIRGFGVDDYMMIFTSVGPQTPLFPLRSDKACSLDSPINKP